MGRATARQHRRIVRRQPCFSKPPGSVAYARLAFAARAAERRQLAVPSAFRREDLGSPRMSVRGLR